MERYRLPGIVGIILVGALVGPNALGLLECGETIVLLGNVGIVYLMSLAGLDIDLEEFQFTPPDAEFAHEPQWTSIAETGVPVFQQWQYDPGIREDYGTMHSFYPSQNQTAGKTLPE
jgi:hypothetical protein